MNASEIQRMACLETDHWWYQGLRHMIARTLRSARFALPPRPKILDAGCGTGELLRFLGDAIEPEYLGGFDVSSQAVALAQTKAPRADVYQSDIRCPQLRHDDFHLILSCDVISIAGVPESKNGLAQLVSALRPGGLLILNLPAFEWMRSRHDLAIGTRDRLCAAHARRLMADLGLRIEVLTYRVFALFPLVVAARLPGMLASPTTDLPQSDLRAAWPWVNKALAVLLEFENAAVAHGLRFPWGSSVYVVARKPLP